MSLYGLFASKGSSGFGYNTTAEQATEGLLLQGQTILVTGCNAGLGYETMRVLALRGARVVGTARTEEKAKAACDSVKGQTVPLACELSDPASIRACVEAIKQRNLKLDAIICNAGIMALPKLELVHGYEKQFLTNHIGHFMLVNALIEQLTEAGRVIMVSSAMHKRAPKAGIRFDNLDGSKQYDGWDSYSESKMANVLFAKELARRFSGTKRTANAVHPGVIPTTLGRHMNSLLNGLQSTFGPLFMKTVAQGAATQVHAAASPAWQGISGEYLADCNIAKPRADANDAALARKLWEVSEKIVAELSPSPDRHRDVEGRAPRP
jgi:NAD(P)-dependent dehydrogenase (short-subunit alcohol dehydrogenase family)